MANLPIARLLLPAIAAFFGYGGWSLYINSNGDMMSAMSYALSYGSYSFIITLITTAFMEALFRKLHPHSKAAFITIAFTCLLLNVGAWAVNYAAGTPNILLTILPGASFSTIFVLSYITALSRSMRTTNNR